MTRTFAGLAVVDGEIVDVVTTYPPISGGSEEVLEEEEQEEEEEGDPPPDREVDQKAHDKTFAEMRRELAATRRENQQIKEQLGSATERAVEEIASRITGKEDDRPAAPERNPYDRDLESDRYEAWQEEAEERRAAETLAAAKAEAAAAGRSSAQVEFAYREGVRSEKDFLADNGHLTDDSGQWSEQAWTRIGGRLMAMQGCTWNGSAWVRTAPPRGSGDGGAVTPQDIEGVVWADPVLRAEMQTANTRRVEDRITRPQYGGGVPRRPSGAAPATKATTGEEAYDQVQSMLDGGATMKDATRYIGTLPPEVRIDFMRTYQRRG